MNDDLLMQVAKTIQDRADALELLAEILSEIDGPTFPYYENYERWDTQFRLLKAGREPGQLVKTGSNKLKNIMQAVEYGESLGKTMSKDPLFQSLFMQAKLDLQSILWDLRELELWRSEASVKDCQHIVELVKESEKSGKI